jgi:predicted enzyme related to lactoylglutathione lyase
VITAVHGLIYSKQAEAVREFLRDTLGWASVDAGGGWLIFRLPPAELGVHPTEGESSFELMLMCDDLEATIEELKGKGVEFEGGVTEAGFGRTATIRLPDGSGLMIYQPLHPVAYELG